MLEVMLATALSGEIISVFALLLVAVILFVTEKLPVDVVSLCILAALLLLGLVNAEEGLSGFASTATVTVGAMFILSSGLQRTGAVGALGRAMRKIGDGQSALLLAVMVTIALPPTVTLPTHDPFPSRADPERTFKQCLDGRAHPDSKSRASNSRAAPSRQGDLEETMPARSGLIQVHPDWMRHEHVLVRQHVGHVAQYLQMFDSSEDGGVVQEMDELVMSWYDNTLRRVEGQLESKAEDAEKLWKAALAAVLAILAAGAMTIWHQLQTVV